METSAGFLELSTEEVSGSPVAVLVGDWVSVPDEYGRALDACGGVSAFVGFMSSFGAVSAFFSGVVEGVEPLENDFTGASILLPGDR